jgi:hypothetical protein
VVTLCTNRFHIKEFYLVLSFCLSAGRSSAQTVTFALYNNNTLVLYNQAGECYWAICNESSYQAETLAIKLLIYKPKSKSKVNLLITVFPGL